MATAQLTNQTQQQVITQVKGILTANFDIAEKTQIELNYDRLTFACPYCGDSTVSHRKKRGNIYWDSLHFHCFNCGQHRLIHNFLKDFNIRLGFEDYNQILSLIDQNNPNRTQQQSNVATANIFEQLKAYSVSLEQFKQGFVAYEFTKGHKAYDWLSQRLLHRQTDKFLFSAKSQALYVLNTDGNNLVFGAQMRKLHNKGLNKYYTYNLSYIRRQLNLDPIEDEHLAHRLDTTSVMFNVLQADFTRPLYVFEGPLDALFLPNSVGLASVTKNIDKLAELPNSYFFFDNDSAGRQKMTHYLKQGCYVFLWQRCLNNLGLNQYKVKDLNDLINICYAQNIKLNSNKLHEYFSNDPLDLWYL